MNYFEETISTKEVYKGKIINVEQQIVKLPDGKEATRDIVRHNGASVIIPLTNDGKIYLVKQFRKPIEKVTLELPAGKLDKGEDPKDCAVRELQEETGLVAANIKHCVSVHTTPGFTDEVLHIYLATGLDKGQSAPDEDEFIDCELFDLSVAENMILSGKITDSKTIIGILLAKSILSGSINI